MYNIAIRTYNGYIKDTDKLKLRSEFNTDYYYFYNELNFDDLINQFNSEIICNEKPLVERRFKKALRTYNGYIKGTDKLKLRSKFNTDYYDFYDELNFDKIIDETNDKLSEKQKVEILNDFKDKLDLPRGYISYSEKIKIITNFPDYIFDMDELIENYNKFYIEEQMELNKEFFENIADRTLDNDQIVAVLTDDDNTQIVAGAGTGKTLTIQAKVKFLIEKQNISPHDILCITFSNTARNDLERKIKKTIGNKPVNIKTFHSIGYSILGINGEERKVPEKELINLIDDYFKSSVIENPVLAKDVIEFFAYYFNIIHINQVDLRLQTIRSKLNELDEYDEYLKEYLQVEHVGEKKEYMESVPELIAANYFFIHNISYEIPKNMFLKYKNYDTYINSYYKYLFANQCSEIPDNIKQEFINDFDEHFGCKEFNYYPNFYLPEHDIYLDLISLNDEKDEYEIDNNLFKSNLIKIHYRDEDIESLLNDLNKNLTNFDVKINNVDYNKLFDLLIIDSKLPEYAIFIKTLERFINLFKGNALNIDYDGNDISKYRFNEYRNLNNKNYSGAFKKRIGFFLDIIEKVYEIYLQRLNKENLLDFNDMINDAVIKLRKGAYIHNYKYIFVDEYQDTSHTRYNLLKEMQNRTGAKVIVVGDDWQSIYGFTGCDINLFSEFDKYFDHPKMVKIQITHRNSQDLVDVVGKFILKNKNQIPKKLKSDNVVKKKPIKLVEYISRSEEILGIIEILDEISKKDPNAEVLILGRNNKDINEILCKNLITTNDYMKINYFKKPNLKIEYKTVHKSKGLDADYVIVLNLNNKLNGFPNKMENDPILDFVNNKKDEDIDYAEERRLFYVALTRTKNNVYVFHKSINYSQFIDELKDENKVDKLNFKFSNEELMEINNLLGKKFEVIETDNVCPNCGVGKVNLILNNEKGTSYFRCSNFCGWDGGPHHNESRWYDSRQIAYVKYAKVCDECGGMLVVKENGIDGSNFLGCNFHKERDCCNSIDLPSDFDLS